MNFFLRTIVIKALLLFILPVYGFSQEFFDDIYYNDNEVNYDFLDICNDLENDTFESGIMEKSHENYIYDEDFSYSEKINKFQNYHFDYYWDYNLYYSPWDHHYYNYHGIYGVGWPYYNHGWGYSSWGYPSYGWGYPSYGWGYPSYGWGYPSYGWGYPSYGWGWPYHSHGLSHSHFSYYDYNILNADDSNFYYGHRSSTNSNQSTQSNLQVAPYSNNRMKLDNTPKNKNQNLNYSYTNKEQQKNENQNLNYSYTNKEKPKNNTSKNNRFKKFLNNIIQENSNNSSKSNNYNRNNKSNNYNRNNKSNNHNRNNYNNSTRSNSNSSRGGRKP